MVLSFTQFTSFLCLLAAYTTAVPTVDLGYATYNGQSTSAGVTEFLGMRYAAPPLGDLRFRAPQDPVEETEVQNATSYGPICYFVPGSSNPVQTPSEDCLFINVQVPTSVRNDSDLPVMVWFQGGGFSSNYNANYNATGLIDASEGNVIVVTFNSRVGLFGFLASEEIRADGDLNASILDQQYALAWVQKYIANFGGDPDNVTAFGTSAGAGSILLLTVAQNANASVGPMFNAAIAEDHFEPEFFTVTELDFQYQQVLNSTDCSSLDCLRSLSGSALQAANINRPFPGQLTDPLFPFGPCLDDILFPDLPRTLLAEGRFHHVPLLQGIGANEGTIFVPQANTTSQFNTFFPVQFPDLNTTGINDQYAYVPLSPNGSVNSPYFNRLGYAYADSTFTCYGLAFASSFAAAGLPVYSYLYDVLDPVLVELGLGVPHTFEVDAVWGPGNALDLAYPATADSYENVNSGIVPVVQAYWTSFARTHDPNTLKVNGSPIWETWGQGAAGNRLKIQTNATAMQIVDDQQINNCQFWDVRSQQLHH